jgi:hypothetical protein
VRPALAALPPACAGSTRLEREVRLPKRRAGYRRPGPSRPSSRRCQAPLETHKPVIDWVRLLLPLGRPKPVLRADHRRSGYTFSLAICGDREDGPLAAVRLSKSGAEEPIPLRTAGQAGSCRRGMAHCGLPGAVVTCKRSWSEECSSHGSRYRRCSSPSRNWSARSSNRRIQDRRS